MEIPKIVKPRKIRRMYLDIESSPNIVFSWRVGYKLNIDYANIIKERAIICICYKFEGESKVHSLKWDNGDDKEMVTRFAQIADTADEIVGHNGDKFDMKWIRTRCLFHGVPFAPNMKTLDTLKLSRAGFYLNSNRLNYIAQFLGLGQKVETGGFGLWKNIVLNNDKRSLNKMIRYCKNDVVLLEKVYQKIESYGAYKTHAGVLAGGYKSDCPKCASNNTRKHGFRVSAAGERKQTMECGDCLRRFTVSPTTLVREKRQQAELADVA